MAGAGRKTFVAGNVLTATEVNEYLMDQAVMRFATASARTTALPTPSEGMMSYLDSTNTVEVYDGAAWTSVTGTEIPYAMFTARVTASLSPAIGPTGDSISIAATVTLPAGRFTVTPVCFFTANFVSTVQPRLLYGTDPSLNSASQVTVYFNNTSTSGSATSVDFNIMATQMTSGSASG